MAPAAAARAIAGLDCRAGETPGEEGGDKGVARAGGVDRLDRRRRGPPTLFPRRRLASLHAALDDDERIERRKPRALGLGIVGAGQDRGFLGVGEQDRSALRPLEKIVRPGLAQEFRRRRIDADRLRSRAPHEV